MKLTQIARAMAGMAIIAFVAAPLFIFSCFAWAHIPAYRWVDRQISAAVALASRVARA